MHGSGLLEGHRIRAGAEIAERFAQLIDHRIGTAEIEVSGKIPDVALEEIGIDPLLQQASTCGSSVTVHR